MNEERILRKLASAARGDRAPLIDVSERVLGRIGAAPAPGSLLLWLFSGVASAAAAIVVAFAVRAAPARPDAFADVIGSVMGGMMQ